MELKEAGTFMSLTCSLNNYDKSHACEASLSFCFCALHGLQHVELPAVCHFAACSLRLMPMVAACRTVWPKKRISACPPRDINNNWILDSGYFWSSKLVKWAHLSDKSNRLCLHLGGRKIAPASSWQNQPASQRNLWFHSQHLSRRRLHVHLQKKKS